MKWSVFRYDVNKDEIVNFNIFNSVRFSEGVAKMRKQIWESPAAFIEQLNNELMYAFWCKSEYEIMVGGLFETDCNKLTKIDIYDQVKPNVEQLARYILNYWANEGNE